MRKALLGAVIVATVASLANAAQVHLFLSSPQSVNGATSGLGALASQMNPVLPAGPASATIELWMALNTAEFNAGFLGITGDIMGAGSASGSAAGPLALNNPGGRWSNAVGGAAGASPLVWDRFSLNRGSALPIASNDGAAGSIVLYRLGTGSINYGGADGAMFIRFNAGDGGLGTTDLTGSAGVAFGWGDAGGIDLSSFSPNSDGSGTPGPMPNYDDNNPGFGWIGVSFGDYVVSNVADLTILPEPTTLALLGVAGLFIRRRR